MYPIFASFIPDPTSLKLGKREKFEDSGGNTTMTTLKLAFKNNKSVHLYLNTHVSVYNQKLNQKSTYYEFLKNHEAKTAYFLRAQLSSFVWPRTTYTIDNSPLDCFALAQLA